MREYRSDTPEFKDVIKITDPTDPAHADNINSAPIQVFENTLANKNAIENLKRNIMSESEYNSTKTYNSGDFCIYENNIYKCIKTTTGTWNPTSWVRTTSLYEVRKRVESFGGEIGDTVVTYDDTGSVPDITSLPSMLQCMITGNKLAVTLRNLKAGLKYVLHVGSLVNNCVSDNPNLPLAASQGKVLQDQINVLNANKQQSLSLPNETPVEYQDGLIPINGGWVTDEVGYYNLKMGWVLVQFKATYDNTLWVRIKYGSSTASPWKQLI